MRSALYGLERAVQEHPKERLLLGGSALLAHFPEPAVCAYELDGRRLSGKRQLPYEERSALQRDLEGAQHLSRYPRVAAFKRVCQRLNDLASLHIDPISGQAARLHATLRPRYEELAGCFSIAYHDQFQELMQELQQLTVQELPEDERWLVLGAYWVAGSERQPVQVATAEPRAIPAARAVRELPFARYGWEIQEGFRGGLEAGIRVWYHGEGEEFKLWFNGPAEFYASKTL